MSKFATKASGNVWCEARYAAAKGNGRLSSREGAAEELGIDRSRLARIELGSTVPYPEEALLMADMYKSPELKNYFCREMCPLGKNMPKVDCSSLDRIGLKAMSSFRKVIQAKDLLLDITEDGIVDESEKEDLKKIIDILDEVGSIAQSLKAWVEKNMREG